MYLVDEQHIPRVKRSQQAGEVSRPVKHGAGGNLDVDPHLVGYDMCEGGLSESRRAVEKGMIKGFPAHLRSFYIYPQIGHDFTLTGEIFQFVRPDNSF